ncbi:nucleic acid-binding protein [Streptomyces acidiscabies]|uniref:nucleic acid-binding protein n=1 Tax=Streptomyces acidiscabies TaxID=42234 RepID=UPI000951723B|nr:nucleic acid-binding protein [Streptomyces acidiscabies]
MPYEYPDDLLTVQQALNQVRADLTNLYERLPYSVEPMEAWQRPEGYWLASSPAYPDSPGWTEQEQLEVAALRERERDLTAAILTHAFWNDVAGPERPDARSQLRHALAAASGGQEQEL